MEKTSPDCRENPFAFFFKKRKIETKSGKWLQKKQLPKLITALLYFIYFSA
jgi:hypothetical protein